MARAFEPSNKWVSRMDFYTARAPETVAKDSLDPPDRKWMNMGLMGHDPIKSRG